MNRQELRLPTRGPLKPGGVRLSGFSGYALACLSVLIAWVLRLALDKVWGDQLPFVTFFIAELIVAQFVGAGPFLFTMAAGFLLADWFFIAPRHSLLLAGRVIELNAGLYFLLSSALLILIVRTQRALLREQTANLTVRQQQEELARLAAIVESSGDAIIGKSLDGTILTWNGGAERLFGYKAAEVLNQSISVIITPEQWQELTPLLERVRRGEPITNFESIRRTSDGRLIAVSLSISPLHDGDGKIVGASTIARDITEGKRAEEERERLLQELKSALANVKTLSGLLPICSSCKKIRDDKGYWNKLELYIHEHSAATFTHGICPECARRLYPQVYESEPPADSGGSI